MLVTTERFSGGLHQILERPKDSVETYPLFKGGVIKFITDQGVNPLVGVNLKAQFERFAISRGINPGKGITLERSTIPTLIDLFTSRDGLEIWHRYTIPDIRHRGERITANVLLDNQHFSSRLIQRDSITPNREKIVVAPNYMSDDELEVVISALKDPQLKILERHPDVAYPFMLGLKVDPNQLLTVELDTDEYLPTRPLISRLRTKVQDYMRRHKWFPTPGVK